jgi:uncharacterized protein YoxC
MSNIKLSDINLETPLYMVTWDGIEEEKITSLKKVSKSLQIATQTFFANILISDDGTIPDTYYVTHKKAAVFNETEAKEVRIGLVRDCISDMAVEVEKLLDDADTLAESVDKPEIFSELMGKMIDWKIQRKKKRNERDEVRY